ncbi:MAG: sucrose-6-phosphatase [Candidatus Atribacteria bacterium]|nr:sucrose-6-phosphatase [Candidatus Atribacteria bacterium]
MENKKKYLVATDLDRTLLPNGDQDYDGSMVIFREIIAREPLVLVYVTGRNLEEVKEAIKIYHPPLPLAAITEIGTRIFYYHGKTFEEDTQWTKELRLHSPNWNRELLQEMLSSIKNLRLQGNEHQNLFKLSYYIDNPLENQKILDQVKTIVKSSSPGSEIISSIDETRNLGLLDIVPQKGTKMGALEYLRQKLGFEKEQVIYAGDSGNDLLPLTSGYRAIVVRNAIDEVKKEVWEIAQKKGIIDRVYLARGYKQLNGYYVSGLIEGLIKLQIISPCYLNRLEENHQSQ